LIFNAFVNLDQLQTTEDGCDTRKFRSFIKPQYVQDSCESVGGNLIYLRLRSTENCTNSEVWTGHYEAAIVGLLAEFTDTGIAGVIEI